MIGEISCLNDSWFRRSSLFSTVGYSTDPITQVGYWWFRLVIWVAVQSERFFSNPYWWGAWKTWKGELASSYSRDHIVCIYMGDLVCVAGNPLTDWDCNCSKKSKVLIYRTPSGICTEIVCLLLLCVISIICPWFKCPPSSPSIIA